MAALVPGVQMVLVSCEVVDKSEKVMGKILTIIFILIKEKVAGNKSSIARIAKFVQADASGQSYKHFRLVNCNSRVVKWGILRA